MGEVSKHGSREGSHQMQMLLEIIKHRFNFRSFSQEKVLPGSNDFLFLARKGRGEDERSLGIPDPFPQFLSSIRQISDSDLCCIANEMWNQMLLMDIGRSEGNGTEKSVSINGRMKLESEMPTLMVLAKGGNSFGNLVIIGSFVFADREHGPV